MAISILCAVKNFSEPLMRSILKGNCKSLVDCLQKKDEQLHPVTLTLKTFGTGNWRRQNQNEDEWQDLDDSSDSAGFA